MIDLQHRRTFLRAAMAAGAAWAAADLSQVEEALAWAAEQTARGHAGAGAAADTSGASGLTALTKAQADVVEAMTARILPAVDGRPGAREAGAIRFIDRALSTFNATQKPLYVEGVADLNVRAAKRWPAAGAAGTAASNTTEPGTATSGTAAAGTVAAAGASFATLTPAQQDELLREIEQTPFFQSVRFDTLIGTFALPSWGGNRDFAGWRMLGVEHQPFFQAPFGYYDANANAKD
jgi:gluconate 2-dehydrogenase gamma chain